MWRTKDMSFVAQRAPCTLTIEEKMTRHEYAKPQQFRGQLH